MESHARQNPEAERIRLAALAALERRRRTRAELETILSRQGFAAPAVAPILDRLQEVGLVDDREYARVYIERRAATRPRGARLLRAELLSRGVSGPDADQALAEYREASSDPIADAVRALQPLLKRSAGLDPQKRRQKAWQFLARRGFSGDTVQAALRRALPPVHDSGGEDDSG